MNSTDKSTSPHLFAAKISLSNDRLFFVTILLCISPLWFVEYLPMVDLPQHAGQVTALRQIWEGNEIFTKEFDINWFTPYLLGYLLLYTVSYFLPVSVASQLIISLVILSIPVLTGRLLQSAGADERWKWLAIPGSYSFAFYWGFLSYMVAVPFALMFLIYTHRFARDPSRYNACVIGALSLLLFFCHLIVLCAASLVALGYLFGKHHRRFGRFVRQALPYTTPIPLIIAWLLFVQTNETSVRDAPIVYGQVMDRLIALVVQPSGLDRFNAFVTPIITGAIAFLPPLSGARFSRNPERWLPFLIGIVLFFFVPAFALNTGFLYERLGIFLVPLWLIVWNRSAPKAEWLVVLIIISWGFVNVGRFAAFARETQHYDRIMAAMEPGRTVASMVHDSFTPLYAAPVYLHFPAWYQAKRMGIVDFNFADFHPQLVRYKLPETPRINEMLAWYPTSFQWHTDGGDRYDYFLVKANSDIRNEIFKDNVGSVELVARSGWWWLYRNTTR